MSLVALLTLYENRKSFSTPKAKKLPSVTIIVPAFNEQGRIKRTVDSLLNLNYPKHLLDIILVDDGSKDNTWSEMQTYTSSRVVAFKKKNGGKASALNFGIAKAKGEIIISMDADSYADKNALINMVGYFDNPNCMAVAPSMKISDPKTLLQKLQFVEYLFGVFLRKASSYLDCIHVTPGPFSAYRKSFFEKHGGYEEGNLTEDLEIAMRIQSLNYKIDTATKAYSYTPGPSQFGSLFRQRVRWYLGFMNNMWKYKKMLSPKYGTFGVFYLPTALLSVVLTMALVGLAFKILLVNSYDLLFHLWSINFDFMKLMDFSIDAFYLSPGLMTMFGIVTLLFSISTIYIAKVFSEDKQKLAIPFILSIFLYGPIYASWWAGSIAYKLTGRSIKWSGVAWKKD